jgi:hypothetical protein
MKLNKMLVILTVCMLTMVGAASSWAATISGNVTYDGPSTGRVHLILMKLEVPQGSPPDTPPAPTASGFGTSLTWTAAGTAAYSISGIDQPGNYAIHAFLDTSPEQTGFANGLSPIGSAGYPEPLVISDSSTQLPNTTVAIVPQLGSEPQAVVCNDGNCSVNPFEGGLVFSWKGPTNQYGVEVADSYNVYWSTSKLVGPGQPDLDSGMATKPAKFDDNHYIITGLDPLKTYYVAVEAVLNDVVSPLLSSAVDGDTSWPPVAPAGSGIVTGNVVFSGLTPDAPLLLIASSDNGGEYFSYYPAPSATQSFSIDGLDPGTYNIMALYDADNSHYVSEGDLQSFNSSMKVTIPDSGGSVALPFELRLTPGNSLAKATTNMNYDQNGVLGYSLQFDFKSQEMVISHILLTGTPSGALTEPISVGPNDWGEFSYQLRTTSRPVIGEKYTATVFYTNGSSDVNKTAEITGQIAALPTLSFPVGATGKDSLVPRFAWRAPMPAGYFNYEVVLSYYDNFNSTWREWQKIVGPGQHSILYDGPPLSYGQAYNWGVRMVDIHGNRSENWQNFTPQNNGPTIIDITAGNGTKTVACDASAADRTVTISGTGFDPTPANNQVFFNESFQATINVALSSATQLTVTMPSCSNLYSTGPIQVKTNGVTASSSNDFVPTFSHSGYTGSWQSTFSPLSGVTVEVLSQSGISPATSDATGKFKLSGIQAGVPYLLKFRNQSTLTTSTMNYIQNSTSVDPGTNTSSYTAMPLTGYLATVGISSGKGLIRSKTQNNSNVVLNATVSAYSTRYNSTSKYTIKYGSACNLDAPETTPAITGRFCIMDIEDGDIVVATASLSGYSSSIKTYRGEADTLNQGNLGGMTPLPTVTGFTPSNALPGSTITITGTNFSTSTVNKVCFGNTWACVYPSTTLNTTLTNVPVPCGAQTGPITVTVNGSATGTSADSFTVSAPTITNFTPSQGPSGATVTITGTNFFSSCGPPYGMFASFYNNNYTNATVASPTQMTVTVPFGALTGPITVGSYIGSATSTTFTVLPAPGMTSAAPSGGAPGTVITVSGTFHDPDINNYEVSFNGSPRDVITAVTSDSLKFTTPADISTYSTYVVKYYGQQYFTFNSFALWNLLTLNIVGSGSVNDTAGANFSCTSDVPQPCTSYLDPTTFLNLRHSDSHV